MKKIFENIKNEILYIFLILFVTVFYSYSTHTPDSTFNLMSAILGVLLVETWFIRVYALYSGRRISEYSEVIQRISIKERLFPYFILPTLFYSSLISFIYFNTSNTVDIIVILVCIFQLVILLINVKSSLRKIYTISLITKAAFDFVCITMFYLLSSVLVRMGFDIYLFLSIILGISFILLLIDLKLHDRVSVSGVIMSILSSIFISALIGSFWKYGIFVLPAIGTLSYYLIVTLWNTRFSGRIRLVDYILPFIYVVLALILILNI